jgi:Tfp pilus assembly protein PilN
MKIELKTLLFLSSLFLIVGAFYQGYLIQTRLAKAEHEILFLDRQVYDIKRQNKRLNRLILKCRRHHKEPYVK